MFVDLRSLWESTSVAVTIDTPGSITIQGQSITASIGVPVANGSITFAGQSVTASLGLPVANGSITFQGQSATAAISVDSGAGSITFQGQATGLAVGMPIGIQGSITYQGQSVTSSINSALDNGSINFNGQSVTLTVSGSQSLDIDNPGIVTFDGQDVTLTATSTPTIVTVIGGAGRYVKAKSSRKEQEKLLEEIVEGAYAALQGTPLEEVVREKVAEFTLPPTRVGGSPRVNWSVFIEDLGRAQELIQLHQQRLIDEDDDDFLMLS